MNVRRIVFGAVLVGALVLVAGADAWACGGQCVVDCGCGVGQSRGCLGGRAYAHDCTPGVDNCEDCAPAPLVAGDLQATEILGIINSSSLEDLPAIAERHHSRLVLHSARRLIAVVDTRCGEASIGSVLFVSAEKARVLDQLRVTHFADFMSGAVTDD